MYPQRQMETKARLISVPSHESVVGYEVAYLGCLDIWRTFEEGAFIGNLDCRCELAQLMKEAQNSRQEMI
ncbi:hypothetical protein D918_00465 [Trichuris suis]|nr:hypothetical protein D918_00465 [Trichuris suis]